VIVTVAGNVRVPVSLVALPPGQKLPLCVTEKVVVLSVRACVTLLHAPPGSDTAVAVIVHSNVPVQAPDTILATKLTPLSPTMVVLAAVNDHGDDEVTQAGSMEPEGSVYLQADQVGGADTPAEVVVLATAPLATMDPERLHLIVETADPVNVRVLAPENGLTVGDCGFHCTAAAEPAATPSTTQETTNDIQIRKRRMGPCSFRSVTMHAERLTAFRKRQSQLAPRA
jgi:hypothetical protein